MVDDQINDGQKITSMLAQPYIENAIWHGVAHTVTRGKIEISFTRIGTDVVCVVEDNGVGRKKSNELKGKSRRTDHISRGLNITEQRLRFLFPKRDNLISVEDVLSSTHEVIGTRVTIKIPQNED